MKFIDLFCGMGNIRLGMEQAGHECVYSVEWDKHKRKIYSVIYGEEPEGNDIREVRGGDLPRADCWCFGFPCQDISVAGKMLGFQGERSSLFFEVMRILREIKEENRPRYLLIENVKNLFSISNGWDFFNLLFTLDEVGYDAEWQLLNSKDFGVPQNRERVYIIGHLRGRSTRKVFPIIRSDGKASTELQELTQGLSDALRVYDPSGLGRTIKAEGGGWGAKTGLYAVSFDRKDGIGEPLDVAHSLNSSDWRGLNRNQKQNAVVVSHGELKQREIANCIDANYHKGLDNHGQRTAILEPRACLTPDRIEKRQNGRRFKEPDEPMFTLTKQDIHGVAIKQESGTTVKSMGNNQASHVVEGVPIREATKQGYTIAEGGDSINLTFPDSKTRRGRVGKGVAQTLDCNCNQGTIQKIGNIYPSGGENGNVYDPKGIAPTEERQGVVEYREDGLASSCLAGVNTTIINNGYRIRKLTPRECMRLQGVPDQITDRLIEAGISDTQLYRAAGDAVTVNVVYEIAKKLI